MEGTGLEINFFADSPGFIWDIPDKQRRIWGPHVSGHKVTLSSEINRSVAKENVCKKYVLRMRSNKARLLLFPQNKNKNHTLNSNAPPAVPPLQKQNSKDILTFVYIFIVSVIS